MATTYSKEQLKEYAVQVAIKHGLDPAMFVAQIEQESGFNPQALSKAGAQGIAQFMPATAKRFGLTDRTDPIASLRAAGEYMSFLKNRYGGNENIARMAYNMGEGNTDKFLAGKRGLPQETAEYNARIAAKVGSTISSTDTSQGQLSPMQLMMLTGDDNKKSLGQEYEDRLFSTSMIPEPIVNTNTDSLMSHLSDLWDKTEIKPADYMAGGAA